MDIRKIKEFIDKLIAENNIERSHLLMHGAVHYMNGNDGTDFDYSCNGRACEFYVFYKNEDGAIKVLVRESEMVAYIYPEENPFGGDYKKVVEKSPFDLYELCCYLQGSRDDKGIWDKPILQWELDTQGWIEREEEDEEDWY